MSKSIHDLSGRELDRAIAEALGWSVSQPLGVGLIASDGKRAWHVAYYHASVDVLREVEPKDRGLIVIEDSDVGGWLAYYDSESVEFFPGGDAKGVGDTEPEARARALLAWLRREKK